MFQQHCDFAKLYSPPFVYFDIGPVAKRFVAHKEPLVKESEYFRAAFGVHFLEGSEGAIKLVEDGPVIVGSVITWLYSGELARCGPDGLTDEDLSVEELLELYIFADSKLVRRLQ